MAASRKLLWKLYPSYLLLIIFSLLVVGFYAAAELKKFYLEQSKSRLEAEAGLVSRIIGPRFSPRNIDAVDAICKEMGGQISGRITVILPDGTVIGDTDLDPRQMENHGDRPEVSTALKGRTGLSTRFSSSEKVRRIYVAVPVKRGSEVVGVVRLSMPMTAAEAVLSSIYLKLAAAGLAVALIAAIISLVVSRGLNRVLQEMKSGAERFAAGELDYRLLIPDSEEMAALALAMNQMASQLETRIKELVSQRNEIEAVLSSMLDAVLVVDCDKNILRQNHAAESLLGIRKEDHGRSLEEVVRNSALLKFAEKALAGEEPTAVELAVVRDGEKIFQVHGTLLKDGSGRKLGAVFVLNDITGLKKLERIRSEFVANVSHELRTPITAIKGFVETLKESALQDPENARKFLDILESHTNRLNAIIEDLLMLSRLEQSEESGEIALVETPLKSILESALELNRAKAEEKKISLELDAPEELKAKINSQLIEQAVSNLIDNAVKFSEPGKSVRVRAEPREKEIVITVSDFGPGIPREHIPRIFERFYRVDKGRSRKMGGTGLGLAIVKHIVQLHKGRVCVESAEGKGTKFSIYLSVA